MTERTWVKKLLRFVAKKEAGRQPWVKAAAMNVEQQLPTFIGTVVEAIEQFNDGLPDGVPEIAIKIDEHSGALSANYGRCSLKVYGSLNPPLIAWQREGDSNGALPAKGGHEFSGVEDTDWMSSAVEDMLTKFVRDAHEKGM